MKRRALVVFMLLVIGSGSSIIADNKTNYMPGFARELHVDGCGDVFGRCEL